MPKIWRDITQSQQEVLRDAEIVNVAFLAVLAGCSARRSERGVAGHTSEEQRRNAPISAVENGILAVSASLSAVDHLFSGNNKPGFSIRSRREGAQGAESGREASGK